MSTLLIGLGGIGSALADRVAAQTGLPAFAIDIESAAQYSHARQLCLFTGQSLRDMLELTPEMKAWLPPAELMRSEAMGGTCQSRQMGRAFYRHAMVQGLLQPLIEAAEDPNLQRAVIITTLVGGTGSGLFMHLASLLREKAPGLELIGEFLMPPNFSFLDSTAQQAHLEANAEAACRELSAAPLFDARYFYDKRLEKPDFSYVERGILSHF